jgi:steroid delta-isomerase-like uncharacterized protein
MDNQAIVERVFRTLDAQTWDELRELLPASVKMHLGGHTLDREGWIGFSQMFFAGFPDGRHDHEQVIAQGEHVTLIGTYRGTHKGAFQGMPATGRAVAAPYLALGRVVDGRVVEVWAQFDSAGLLAQLGALPDPTAADVVVRMLAACDRADWDAVRALVSPDVTAHIGGNQMDRERWQAMGVAFMGAFPDAKHELHQVLVAGDRVTTVCTFTGTHRGAFMGLPPTGKRVAFPVIHVDRVIDGRIVEHRGEFDPAIVARQLGA